MDYETASNFLIRQGLASEDDPNAFLVRLSQGKPPVPGQVTSLLLSVKVVFEGLKGAETLDRQLIYALYLLASESRQQFETQRRLGVVWPPLLDEDLTRIATTVKSILADDWQGL